jgi:hypothetical protein
MELIMQANSIGSGLFPAARRYARENGAGLAGSVLLHVLAALLVVFFLSRRASHSPAAPAHFLPVDLVELGEKTVSPPAQQKAPVPSQRTAHIRVPQTTSPAPPVGVAPHKTRQVPLDDFAAKLRALARLRQPQTQLAPLDNAESADSDATSSNAAPGDEALYAVKDFIRAQVLRRWSVDFSLLGRRNIVVLIHMRMKADGTVTLVQIVDRVRYKKDAMYREVALSARDAVLLSSPFSLPAGHYRPVMDMTLSFNPKDTLH